MLYIKIPENMEYRGALTTNKKGKLLEEDSFVSLTGEREDISIQAAVHAFYHLFHPKKIIRGESCGLLCHKRKPLSSTVPYLEYCAKDTGRSPSDHAVVIDPRAISPRSTATGSPVGRWIHHTLLSPKRREVAEKKETEQRDNRRKTGDSPFAN